MATLSSAEFLQGKPARVVGNAGAHASEIRNATAQPAVPAPVAPEGFISKFAKELPKALSDSYAGLKKGVEKGAAVASLPTAPIGTVDNFTGTVKKGVDLAGAGLDTGFSGLGALFSPVSAAVKVLVKDAVNDPKLQEFASSKEVSDFLDFANKIAEGGKEVADNHPEAKEWLDRGINLLTLGSAKKVPKVGELKSALEEAENGIKNGIDDGVPPGGAGAPPVVPPPSPVAPAVAKEATAGAADIVGGMASSLGRGVRNVVDDLADTAKVKAGLKAKGPSAVKVYEETGTPEFVNAIDKTVSKTDLAAKSKMLDLVEQKMAGTSDKLPRSVVADAYVVPKVDALRSRLGEVGHVIGDAKKDTTRVSTGDLVSQMIGEARKQGVVVTPSKGGFNFTKAEGVSGIDTARINAIKNLFEGFQQDQAGGFSNTISQLAATRKNLSDLTKRTDAAAEVSAPGGAIDNMRRAIAEKISPEYAAATREYSDIARLLEQLDPDLKVRLSEDALADVTSTKLADYARRLLSNNASQAKSVFTSLDELYAKEMARQGKAVPKEDLADLVDFAGALEEGFGIVPRNTFFGQSKNATQNALSEIPLTLGGAANTVMNILTKPKRNDKRVLEAMREYIKESEGKIPD